MDKKVSLYSAPQILMPQATQSKKYSRVPFTQLYSRLDQKYNFKTLYKLENTFGFIGCAISSSATLGSRERKRLQHWKWPGVIFSRVAGQSVFSMQNSILIHATIPSSRLSPTSSLWQLEVWHSQRRGSRGNKKIANQIWKAFHILLMSRYHQL